jgi:hypothetical protein
MDTIFKKKDKLRECNCLLEFRNATAGNIRHRKDHHRGNFEECTFNILEAVSQFTTLLQRNQIVVCPVGGSLNVMAGVIFSCQMNPKQIDDPDTLKWKL